MSAAEFEAKMSYEDEKEAEHGEDNEKAQTDDANTGQHRPGAPVVDRPRGISWILVVLATLSSVFMYALDTTIVADLIPAIVKDLDGLSQISWLSLGFTMGGVALVMAFGKLYGLLNAKWLYVGSTVVFMAASALCGAAPNMDAEIVGRVFAGAGGNGMYMGVLTLLSVTTSDTERPIYLGFVGLVWALGTVLGPVVGGGLGYSSWRWAFYLNLCIGGLFAPLYIFLLPSFSPAKGKPYKDRFRELDWIGMTLSVAGFVLLIMPISFGGAQYAWDSSIVISTFAVSGVVWIAFFIQQVFCIGTTSLTRAFPVHLFRRKEPALLFICMAAMGGAGFIPIFYIPLYFQFTRGDSPIEAAVRLLPYVFLLSATIISNGAMMSKFGYYKPWYIVGSTLAIVGGALLSQITRHTSTSTIYGYEVLVAFGVGAFCQAGYAIIQTLVQPVDLAYALTFMMTAQLGGITFSLTIAGAVFVNEAQQHIRVILPTTPRADIIQLISGATAPQWATLTPDLREATLDAVVSSMRQVYIITYTSAALCLICAIFLSNKRMHNALATPPA